MSHDNKFRPGSDDELLYTIARVMFRHGLDFHRAKGSPTVDILAAIREHHAIVRLPEADYVDGCPTFWDYSLRPIPNEVVIDFGLGTEYRTTLHVNTCRALAAALLAAADAAERG